MLQIRNETPFEALPFVAPDPDGVESVYAVVKGTFTIGKTVAPAECQMPVVFADQYHGEPRKSSLKAASDLSLVKPNTDVLMMGKAYAPGGRPTAQLDISLRVGSLRKVVRVIGDRVWSAGVLLATPSKPKPFETMPLVWERAFGGTDESDGDPPIQFAEDRNPAGVGFRGGKGKVGLDGLPLPNLEDPSCLISSWRDRPAPAGFAPVCPHWEPRRRFAGTYDADWIKHRIPYLPRDFNPRFFQLAPPGLVADGYLEGGEEVEVRGATPEGPLTFALPRLRMEVAFLMDRRWHVRPAPLDTVLIEPDESRVLLTWRAVLACDKKVLRVAAIAPRIVGNEVAS